MVIISSQELLGKVNFYSNHKVLGERGRGIQARRRGGGGAAASPAMEIMGCFGQNIDDSGNDT